ncbi:MAG: MFS transporter [Clostridiales bacterium]|nr:MFS transporter [Clostridiales bacterium]
MENDKSYEIPLILTVYATTGMLGVYLSVLQYTVLGISWLFGRDIVFVGVLIGLHSFGMLVSPLTLGGLSDKIGKRKVLLVSFTLLAAGTITAGATSYLGAFVLAVFITGAGFSVTEATVCAVLADEFPEKSRRHLNFSQIPFSAGALIGPFVAERLIDYGVFFKDLYAYCGAGFVFLGCAFLFIKQKNDIAAKSAGEGRNIVFLLKNRVFMILAACIFIYIGIEAVASGFADSYFKIVAGAPGYSAAALSLFWGAMIPSRFLGGTIKLDAKWVLAIFLVITLIGIMGGMLLPWHTAKLAMFALCGFGCGPVWPLLMNEAAKSNPGRSGLELNAMVVFGAAGSVLYPMVSGVLAGASSPVAAYYFIAASVFIILFLCFRYFRLAKKP